MADFTPMNSCLIEMQLADHFGGHRQVRRVARKRAKEVDQKYRKLLINISKTKNASLILNEAIDNLNGRVKK